MPNMPDFEQVMKDAAAIGRKTIEETESRLAELEEQREQRYANGASQATIAELEGKIRFLKASLNMDKITVASIEKTIDQA